MKTVIRKTTNIDKIRELHQRTFPADDFYEHKGNHYWLVINQYETKEDEVVGFAILTDWGDNIFFLSRAGLLYEARGKGLHLKLIKHRISYAKRIGAKSIVTYTSARNVKSSRNLSKAGMELFEPATLWAGEEFNYWLYIVK